MKDYDDNKDIIIHTAELVCGGYTIKEVSEMTGIPGSTVHWRLRHKLWAIDPELEEKVNIILVSRRKVDPEFLSYPYRRGYREHIAKIRGLRNGT